MKHFLTLLEEVTLNGWQTAGLSNYCGLTYTHEEIAEQIARFHTLFRLAGIQPQDKVALAARNSAEWATAFLAVCTWHAVAVPILAEFTPENIQQLVNHSESRLLFTDRKHFAGMQPDAFTGVRAVISLDDGRVLWTDSDDTAARLQQADALFKAQWPCGLKPEDIHYASDDLDELAVINYTSGTTGTPKGIMLTARSISANLAYSYKYIPNHPGETAVSMLPLAHMYGLTIEFLYTFLGGCHLYFLGKTPTPTILKSAFADIRPYILITVPLVLEKIVKNNVMPQFKKQPLRFLTHVPGINTLIYRKAGRKVMQFFGGNVRHIPVGGAAMSREVEVLLRKMRIPFTIGYGMTECGPLVGYADWRDARTGGCGRVVDHLEIRVDSDNPARKAGEIQLRGDGVMTGYYKNPEATAAAFTQDGWLRTGDLGTVAKDGMIHLRGRSKCMILSSSGQNIYPEEIESKLNALDHINESLVIGRDNRLVALVALAENDTDAALQDLSRFAEDIRRKINQILPSYSQLAKVEVLTGGFVHTPKHSIKRCLYQ